MASGKVNILIVEDEVIIAEDMAMTLEDLGYQIGFKAIDYEEAVKALSEQEFDIVLADITLGGEKDGVDLGRHIRANHDVPLIYITSHADESTLTRAKATNPNGYLVKPFEGKDIYAAIEVALHNYVGSDISASDVKKDQHDEKGEGLLINDSIYIKDGHLFHKVLFSDMLWITSEGNYLEIQTPERRYVIRSSIRDFMQKLPSKGFYRLHKSYIVNLAHIHTIEGQFVWIGENKIPIGRTYRDILLKHVQTV